MSTRDWSRYPTVSFRPDPTLLSQLDDRVSPGLSRHEVARRDLARYYEALRLELRRVSLTDAEWHAVASALEGEYLDPISAQGLADTVAEALAHDGIGEVFGIDDAVLTEKLGKATPFQRIAIIDEIERRRIAHAGG